jgi:hypothetical protein
VNGYAPQLYLKATHEATLRHCELSDLKKYALDLAEAQADVDRLDDLRAQLSASVSLEPPAEGSIRPEEQL